MSYNTEELPPGWIRQFDPNQNHSFWVDTNATPARAIWVHPYEDDQFLNEHPDIRDRLAKHGGGKPTANEPPPPYDAPRRHSYSGSPVPGPSGAAVRPSASQPGTPSADTKDGRKRGFFGKLKDKAIGTKEEREAARRQEALLMQQRAEQRQRQLEELRRQRMSMPVNPGYGSYGNPYGQPYGRSGFGQPAYGPPMGNPYGRRRQGGFGGGGMGGMALPLVGGLAGGLLLGEMLDGDGFGGGDFDDGGGDFGGGDF